MILINIEGIMERASSLVKTKNVVDSTLEECVGCNTFFEPERLTESNYMQPFSGEVKRGKFCALCMNDDDITSLLQ